MSPLFNQKPVEDGYTDEERQDGYKLYGFVLLTLLFSFSIPLLVCVVAGVSALTAVIVATMFGLVLTYNIKRVLERKYREKHPGIG
jgi:hydrogenase-4 membrane subunit HyfE